MASNEYTLSHQDVVKAIVIHQGIHEGFWTLNVNFDVAAGHGAQVPDPCLEVTIRGIGIMRTSPADPFAIDAALVNPPAPQRIEGIVHVAAGVNGTRERGTQFCRDFYRNVAVQSTVKAPSKAG